MANVRNLVWTNFPVGQRSPWPAFRDGRHIPEDPNSETCFTQIQSWMDACGRDHPRCQLDTCPSLPRRVIDVGAADGLPYLYISKEGGKSHYVTLSHCWGKTQLLTTTKATINSRMQEINWIDLSKTFQDAIKVIRSLGLKCIWNDSLCTIQDDLEDWSIEAAKMASMYANSYLTIAATGAADGGHGLLSKRGTEEFWLTFRSDYTSNLVEPEPSLTGSDRILVASLYRQAASHLKSGLSRILGPDLVQSNPAKMAELHPQISFSPCLRSLVP